MRADDNDYAPSVEPSFIVHYDGSAVWTINNELGFKPSDVRAICDAGGSSKSGREGFIGHKGACPTATRMAWA